MLKKVKEYFKERNPYLMASAAIVIVSVAIISLILKDEISARKEADTTTVSMQQSLEESAEDEETILESGETEVSEDLVEEELETTEILVLENVEVSVHSMPDTENTLVPEIVATPETTTLQEETITPDIAPEPQPESSVPQEPEVEIPEELPVPEEMPAPEEIPAPEEPSVPEITPFPEVTPVPHEHSWIFESWYQTPTCSNGGLVNEICAHCGETQVTGGTPTGEHSYTVESSGDCCSPEVVVCSECNHREVGEKNPSNHIDVEDGFCYGCGKKTD